VKTEDAEEKETRTILLVDDEDMVRDVGVHLFQSLGYSVLEAANGMEAVDIYKKNSGRINLVFLDIVMPGMSGGDTYDRIKEINPHVKVLLSSGYGIDDQAVEILARGADSFIQKPFSLEDLSQKIKEIMGGESAPAGLNA
jgi:CheY-like chemotaxis protein